MTAPGGTVRAVVVDDEEPARELVRAFLEHWPMVEIVGEAGDGGAALELVRTLHPDLVFLDVQMPRMNGFDVVTALAPEELPLVVFITAYDHYALRAFEVSACDYLLKPFDADRFANTLHRVLARRREASGNALQSLLAQLETRTPGQVVVKIDGRHIFLSADDIEWVEAVAKDVRIHVGARVLTVRESLTSLGARLDPRRFVRVHRSAIVNRSHIREMQPWFKGDYALLMRSGARLTSGRTFRREVQSLLKGTSP